MDKCIICQQGFDESSQAVNVFEKGLKKLIDVSKEREMTALNTHLVVMSKCNGKVMVHHSCRRTFTDTRKRSSSEKPAKRLRSSLETSSFDWKSFCFLCSEKVDNSNLRRDPIVTVQTLPIRDSLIERAKEINSDWGNQVLGRLLTCNDLVAEEAIYHLNCMNKFRLQNPSLEKKGRPVDIEMMNVYEKVCNWLENESDCELYTLRELYEKMMSFSNTGKVYTIKTLKLKLQDRYKEHIYFSQLPGRENVIGFRNMTDRIISEMKNKEQQTEEDIIIAAAKLVKADIREMEKNTNYYPTTNDITDDEKGNEWIPESLQTFLRILIPSKIKKKTIGQCITQAARPKSIMCPLVFGLGVELEKSFGSKWLVNHLSRLGYCITNEEVLRFKESAIESVDVKNEDISACFMQWVADNVDHNIVTLTGNGTFHGMGIISITQPAIQHQQQKVFRFPHRKKVSEVIKNKGIEMHHFIGSSRRGLSNLMLKSIRQLKTDPTFVKEVDYNILWHTAWFSSSLDNPRPNWSGFMQDITSAVPVEDKSLVSFLPIIDMNPSDESCIYSTLLFIIEQAKSLNIAVPCVTFDQPLWLKAVGIIEDSNLNIVCRLGGFHTLMSFLGSLGHIMKGSGLEELFAEVYAEHTVVHMISGKAISRALRAHFLVESALVTLLVTMMREEEAVGEMDWEKFLSALSMEGKTKEQIEEQLVSDEFVKFHQLLSDRKTTLSAKSRTAKLWILYLDYISTIKKYIIAERTSNWALHLKTTKEILNLFAATGHINYAKSARLYLQQMMELKQKHPWLHHKFEEGFHAVRRSDRYWAGLWSDLIIEQTMMRSIKTRGGLTRGRGMNEDTRHLWVLSLSDGAAVHQAMAEVSGLTVKSSEQHVDMGIARRATDYADCQRFLKWLQQRNPFLYEDTNLHSLSLGLVSGENDDVNCDKAEEIGQMIQENLNDMTIPTCKIKRKDQVKSLITLQNKIKIDGDPISVNPTMLFTRLVAVAQREEEDIEDHFSFELTHEPMSLFKKGLMRKPDKPSLRRAVMKEDKALRRDQLPNDVLFVIDGGALLHRVRWLKDVTFDKLCEVYVHYVRQHYKFCIIVFDGYEGPSTKSNEHMRRIGGGKRCPNVDVIGCNKVPFPQDRFMTNDENKTGLIRLLGAKLEQDGQIVKICKGDADATIASTTLERAQINDKSVVTVADDTDVAMMLLYHLQQRHADVFFFQEKENRGWKMNDICHECDAFREYILFVHAFSGCDTTSAPFGRGKSSILTITKKNETMQTISDTMSDVWAEQEDVGKAAIKAFQIIYGGKDNEKLCKIR